MSSDQRIAGRAQNRRREQRQDGEAAETGIDLPWSDQLFAQRA
ncbi:MULTISPECIES: hypothetical protein [unclassified Nocardia]